MNSSDLYKLYASSDSPVSITVTTTDYSYDGYLITVFEKRSGVTRCIVEDDNGRLFIHNPLQIRKRNGNGNRT